MNDFIWIQPTDPEGLPTFINLSLVSLARLTDKGLYIHLAGDVSMTITGKGMAELITLIMKRSSMTNGDPVAPELLEDITTAATKAGSSARA